MKDTTPVSLWQNGPESGPVQAAQRPLILHAKNGSPRPVKPTVDEVDQFLESVFRKYQLHSHLRRIWDSNEGKRVRGCQYYLQAGDEDSVVEIWRDTGRKRAHFRNLQTCASVWSCPICSPKIAKRRSIELRHITSWARSEGYRILFMTLTSQHDFSHDLGFQLGAQRYALSQLRKGKRSLKKILPYDYFVRAREVTHGKHGWHPHYHELIITRDERSVEEITGPVFQLWRDMSLNAKLNEPSPKAFKLTDSGEEIAEYIAKFGREPEWTEAEELTLGMRKVARHQNETPWGLLKRSMEGSPEASALWVEFSNSIKAYHQLERSPGLIAAAGLKDKTDGEIAKEEGQAETEWYRNIPQSIWDRVKDRHRAHILQIAATQDKEVFDDYLIYATLKSYEQQES